MMVCVSWVHTTKQTVVCSVRNTNWEHALSFPFTLAPQYGWPSDEADNPILWSLFPVGAAVVKQQPLHPPGTATAIGGTSGEGDICNFPWVRCRPVNGSPPVCTSYFASTDLKSFVLGCVATTGPTLPVPPRPTFAPSWRSSPVVVLSLTPRWPWARPSRSLRLPAWPGAGLVVEGPYGIFAALALVVRAYWWCCHI